MARFPSPLFCLAENTGVWFLFAQFWNRNVFVFDCQIFLGPESQSSALMSSMTERHISPLFYPSFAEGLPSAGLHLPPSVGLSRSPLAAHSHRIPLFLGSYSSPVLGAGGRRESSFPPPPPHPFYSSSSFNYRRTEFELFLSSPSFPSFPGQCF